MFKAPFSFNGRITRTEYAISLAVFACIYGFGMSMLLGRNGSNAWVLLVLVADWFWFAQGCKRCHDFGYFGWLQFIPLINPFALLLAPGDSGFNRYGANPRGSAATVVPVAGPPTLPARPPMPMGSTYVSPLKVASFCCSSCGAQNKDVPYTQSPNCEYCGTPSVKK